MTGPSDLDTAIAKRSGRVAILILAVFAGWGLLQFLGVQMELSRRVMGLGDAVALVGMGWAIYETAMIWRMRREKE
ncbi:DUF5337 family protein [Jannaschia helgolandensis]|jgi:uncharacterized protein DUF5337|uniref:DUF5337 family protein n=1 Tax=Jannaschia helgolandensis TaxID=188906 RepID=UPI0030D6E0A0|tara:strand:+ start:179 stop:406 length:228 start_codon:yes stop_codon:yes gene_type:complete